MNDDKRKLDLQNEIHVLEKADRDIEAANEHIRKQTELIQELERDAHDVTLALKLLMTLKDSKQAMLDHRKLIVERIEHLS